MKLLRVQALLAAVVAVGRSPSSTRGSQLEEDGTDGAADRGLSVRFVAGLFRNALVVLWAGTQTVRHTAPSREPRHRLVAPPLLLRSSATARGSNLSPPVARLPCASMARHSKAAGVHV